MDAKLNHSDLSALLAKEANISCAKAEQFTKAMFDLIIEGLEKDGIVKINGLGTFKVSEVASRSSVNVNTGEKFEIKGHKKLTFTPADTLKDNVNQPFAMFEPVEVDESYVDNDDETEAEEPTAVETVIEETPQAAFIPTEEEMPAEEESLTETTITEIIEEEQPVEEVPQQHTVHATTARATEETAEEIDEDVVEEATDNVVEEAPVEENEPVACDTVEETIEETVEATETAVESKCSDTIEAKVETETVATEENVTAVGEKAEEKIEDKTEQCVVKEEIAVKRTASISTTHETAPVTPRKGNSGMKWIFSLLVIAAIAACTLFVLYRNGEDKQQTENLVAENVQPAVKQSEKVVIKADTLETAKADTIATETPAEPAMVEPVVEEEYTFVMCDELAARNIKEITIADTTLYKTNGEFAVHKVESGDRLTRIAMKYYGDKRLWPYIVMYNKLKDPNGLCKGMELAIPKLKVVK